MVSTAQYFPPPPPSNNFNHVQRFVEAVNPYRDVHIDMDDEDDSVDEGNSNVDVVNELVARGTMREYKRLMTELQTPLYENSEDNALATLLRILSIKQKTGMTDTAFDYVSAEFSSTLSQPNAYPSSYASARKKLKSIEMPCVKYDACFYGCSLYYGNHLEDTVCHVCGDDRFEEFGSTKVAKKTLWYFPLTDRLQRLFLAPETAEWMRWHGERERKDDDILTHPADGEDWIELDATYPHFSRDIRNVRLPVATDDFCPLGPNAPPYSLWPIIVILLNFPSSMAMKKEYNILTMLVSGPNSLGKCLYNFMQPLIDELNHLWRAGAVTWDGFKHEAFIMRAAVMWTISDYPGLGMLGGIQTKGYKTCLIRMDSLDATNNYGRTTYQGARRYLDKDYEYRRMSHAFDGTEETRGPPPILSGRRVLQAIDEHVYPDLSQHENLKPY